MPPDACADFERAARANADGADHNVAVFHIHHAQGRVLAERHVVADV